MNYSKQRDLILKFLKSTKTHPTADEVYEAVRIEEPNISLGTVYRNLNLLAANNMILRLHMNDGIDHFDADTSEHFHFYCNNCGRVFDLSTTVPAKLPKLCKAASEGVDGLIEGCKIYFYGKCKSCIEKLNSDNKKEKDKETFTNC